MNQRGDAAHQSHEKRERRLSSKRIERPVSTGPRERDSDLRLIARVRQRDRQAFAQLYRAYRSRMGRFLAALVRDPRIAEEVLDDTLMVVWERAEHFKGESKLSTWIFAIAYRKAMKALRRHDAPLEDERAEAHVSEEATPEEAFARLRVHDLIRDALAELSPNHRAVVELTYFSGLGYREIAEIMECPVDTVKTRMFHARRHLKKHLDGELEDWI